MLRLQAVCPAMQRRRDLAAGLVLAVLGLLEPRPTARVLVVDLDHVFSGSLVARRLSGPAVQLMYASFIPRHLAQFCGCLFEFSASISHLLGELFGADDWRRILKFRSSRFQCFHHRFEVEFILIHGAEYAPATDCCVD
jgi:hypothetical protein